MRAVRFHAHGGPDVLQLETIAEPVAGPGEVLVRLLGRGINRAEILTIQGIYPRTPSLPATPGREGAGIVEKLGDGVDGLVVGQRVMLRNGSALGSGTWCEKVRVGARDLIPTPASLDDAQAGGAFVSALTAYCGVVEILGLQRGDSLVVTAASSPTGLAVLQLCRHLGIVTFATTRREERSAALHEHGADAVVVESRDDLVATVRHATGGRGASAAFDAVSGEVGRSCFKAIAEGGTLLQYGSLSLGPVVVNPGTLIFKQKHVQGFWLTRVLEEWPAERTDRVYATVVDLLSSQALRPPVHARYPLEQVQDAVREMNAMQHLGKVVLVD